MISNINFLFIFFGIMILMASCEKSTSSTQSDIQAGKQIQVDEIGHLVVRDQIGKCIYFEENSYHGLLVFECKIAHNGIDQKKIAPGKFVIQYIESIQKQWEDLSIASKFSKESNYYVIDVDGAQSKEKVFISVESEHSIVFRFFRK